MMANVSAQTGKKASARVVRQGPSLSQSICKDGIYGSSEAHATGIGRIESGMRPELPEKLVLELLNGCGMIWRSEKRRLLGMDYGDRPAVVVDCRLTGTHKSISSVNSVARPQRWYRPSVDQSSNCVTVVEPFSKMSTSKRKTWRKASA